MKNSNVLLPTVIAMLTGITLLLSARHENTNAVDDAVVDAAALPAQEGDVIESTAQPTEAARQARTPNAAKLSYGLDEIARMVEVGIQPEVMEAFIDNSTVAYAPNAADIVYLRELGAPPGVLASLIRHGGRLREEGIREFKESQATLSRQASAAASPADYNMFPAQTVQPAAVSYNTYTYPALVRPDYPIYGYAGPQYACFPRYNYSYSRYGLQRQYFPAYYNSCRPYSTYNYCAPRFIRSSFPVGFRALRSCRPGTGLRVGIRR
jgi:hypothetical protein